MNEREKKLNDMLDNLNDKLDKALAAKEKQQTVKREFKALEQEPKSEWERDHVILKAYSDGANEVLDKIRAEIVKKHLSIVEKNGFDSGRTYGYEEVLDIIDKYKAERNDK